MGKLFIVLVTALAAAMAGAQLRSEYRLQPEDAIAIRVVGEPEMSVDTPINFDGTISVPYLGFIKAAGKTTRELEQEIRAGLMNPEKQYFKDPKVTINIIQFRPSRVSVLGAVAQPGEYFFKPGDRLLSAISQAHGVVFGGGDLKRATLVRKGVPEQIPLDLDALLYRSDMSQNYELKDGDVINIPETRKNRVSVIGYVQRPGQFPWYEGMTLADAVSQAGGDIPYRSRMSAIQIQRVVPGREFETNRFNVDFTKFTAKNDFTQNVALEPGDVIFVPSSKNVDVEQLSRIANVVFTIQSLFNRNFSFFPR